MANNKDNPPTTADEPVSPLDRLSSVADSSENDSSPAQAAGESRSETSASPPPPQEEDKAREDFLSNNPPTDEKTDEKDEPSPLDQLDSSSEEKEVSTKKEESPAKKLMPDILLSRFSSEEKEDDDTAVLEDDLDDEALGGFYQTVLETLIDSKDLGIDAVAKARIQDALEGNNPPQVVGRDLLTQKVINKVQLARAVARSQKRREITSFLDVPAESIDLRGELDGRLTAVLREARILPLKMVENATENGETELHLAHESALRNLVLEAALSDLMPNTVFVWHFAMREVCGAYWLAGEHEDVDAGMEAEALLDRIISNAVDARSSDIHIDPSVKGEPRAIVKYRIDGSVQPKEVITLEQLERLKIRIENVARMPKVNLNHPSKGAFTRSGYDWRVQMQPHAGRHGPVPRVVIRRLQPDVMPMEALGYPTDFIDKIKQGARAPNGVIFWTGPTGSGKTESIHAAVVSVNPMARGLSVHTIEDPPEKRVSGYAVQMEVSEEDEARTGLQLLKSSLRADPDVIIFGEVRDPEMAKLVFEAANTGHLVFTTLHTNTALDAIVRLDELGIFGFLTSYVRGIAAQRLIRRLCVHCRQPMKEPDDYTRYVFDKYDVDIEGAQLFTANPDGCASCNFKGYHGRIAVAEWLKPSKELVDASSRRAYEDLEDIARRAGWEPMGKMGVEHVKKGITDAEELSRQILELASESL